MIVYTSKVDDKICKYFTYYAKGVKHYTSKLIGMHQRPMQFEDSKKYQEKNFDVEIGTK